MCLALPLARLLPHAGHYIAFLLAPHPPCPWSTAESEGVARESPPRELTSIAAGLAFKAGYEDVGAGVQVPGWAVVYT